MMGRVESLVFMVIGVIGVADGVRIAAQLRPGNINDPIGPDRYLMIIAALLFVLGLVQLVWPRRQTASVGSSSGGVFASGGFPITAQLLISLIVYAFALPVLGYAPATLLFFLAAFWIMGVRPLWVNAGASILSAAAAYLLFQRGADMALPTTPLGF